MNISTSDIRAAFDEAESYLEMMMIIELKGGNKAKMNRYLQRQFEDAIRTYYGGGGYIYKKTILFIKQGIVEGEIPIKFIWNALGCPKNIEEVKDIEY